MNKKRQELQRLLIDRINASKSISHSEKQKRKRGFAEWYVTVYVIYQEERDDDDEVQRRVREPSLTFTALATAISTAFTNKYLPPTDSEKGYIERLSKSERLKEIYGGTNPNNKALGKFIEGLANESATQDDWILAHALGVYIDFENVSASEFHTLVDRSFPELKGVGWLHLTDELTYKHQSGEQLAINRKLLIDQFSQVLQEHKSTKQKTIDCVVLQGAPGTGKTTFIEEFFETERGKGKYDFGGLIQKPRATVNDLLIGILSAVFDVCEDENFDERIEAIQNYLRSKRSSIWVIDDFDYILEQNSDYENRLQLERLLRTLSDPANKSQLVIVCQQQLPESILDGPQQRLVMLPELSEEFARVLLSKRFKGILSELDQDRLVAIACATKDLGLLHLLFYEWHREIYTEKEKQDIAEFARLIGERDRPSDQRFLNSVVQPILEKNDLRSKVLIWLTIEHEFRAVLDLTKLIYGAEYKEHEKEKVEDTVDELVQDGWINRRQTKTTLEDISDPSYTLSTSYSRVVREWITNKVIEEVQLLQPRLLHQFALRRASIPEYMQTIRQRSILEKVKLKLLNGRQENVDTFRLAGHITGLLDLDIEKLSYLHDNILALLDMVGADLSDKDLSRLSLREVDFRRSVLHRTKMQGTQFRQSLFRHSFGSANKVAVSAIDGGTVAAVTEDGKLVLWQIGEGVQILDYGIDNATDIALDRQGRYLVTANKNELVFRTLTKANTDQSAVDVSQPFKVHLPGGYDICDITFSSSNEETDFDLLAVATEEGWIGFWDVSTCAERMWAPVIVDGKSLMLTSIKFRPGRENSQIACSTKSGDVFLMTPDFLESGFNQLIQLPLGNSHTQSSVSCLAWSNDGNMIAAGDQSGQIRTWSQGSDNKWSLKNDVGGEFGDMIQSLEFRTNTQLITASHNGLVKLWSLNNNQSDENIERDRSSGLVFWIDRLTCRVNDLCLTSNKQLAITACSDAIIRVTDLNIGMPMTELHGYSNGVQCLSFDNESQTLYVGNADGNVEPLHWLNASFTSLPALRLSKQANFSNSLKSWARIPAAHNNQLFVTGWDDGSLELLSLAHGYLNAKSTHKMKSGVRTMASSSDQQYIAVALFDDREGFFKLYRRTTTNELVLTTGSLGQPVAGILSICFRHTVSTMFTSHEDGTVRAWEYKSQSIDPLINNSACEVKEWQSSPLIKSAHAIRVMTLLNNDRDLACIDDVGSIYIVDVTNQQISKPKPRRPRQDGASPHCIMSLPTISGFFFGSDNRKIRFYDVAAPDSRTYLVASLDSRPLSLVISPDGSTLFCGEESGTVSAWNVIDPRNMCERIATRSSAGLPYLGLDLTQTDIQDSSSKLSLKELGAIMDD